MRRGLLTALALALLAALPARPAPAQGVEAAPAAATAETRASDVRVSGVTVLEYGVFSSNVERRERVGSVADGIRDTARDFALVQRGTNVTARLGTGIGIRYVLTGAPRGAEVEVEVVVRHPALRNPQTGRAMSVSSARYARVIGQVAHSLWSFDTPEDLIPGEYAVEVCRGGRVLTRQVFRVRVAR